MTSRDAIFALGTPAQASPVALIRVSGAAVADLCSALKVPFQRGNVVTEFLSGLGATPLHLWVLPGPDTLTGEDTIEARLPGNPEITREFEEFLRGRGCRDAEPGEFTRRALDAGKLDLSRAEAVLQLINAGSEGSRKQAVADLAGETARALGDTTERLRGISARFEMLFDFSEEEHAETKEATLRLDLQRVTRDLRNLVGAAISAPHRDRPVVALFGLPNAGKSTLFNALLGKPRALVSATPGTTRDPVNSECPFGSHTALLVDLSGVGASDGDHGRFAETARQRAIESDVLLLLDAPHQDVIDEFNELQSRDASVRSRTLWVRTKTDLAPSSLNNPAGIEGVGVSALSGAGIDELRERIAARLAQASSGGATSLMRIRAQSAAETLDDIEPETPFEGVAGDVRHALRLLDEALMSEAPGNVLDLIFSRFCIGK